MGSGRVKDEELQKIQLGYRYVGLDLTQFHWECLKLMAASEELTETDILRRVIKSWSEALPSAIQEKARAATAQVEAWKARKLHLRKHAKFRARRVMPSQTAAAIKKFLPVG